MQYKGKELLEKYIEGNASEEEQAFLETWYLQYELKDIPEIKDAEKAMRLDKIRAVIFEHSRQEKYPVKVVRIWPALMVAASLLLTMFIGGYLFFNKHRHSGQQPAIVKVKINDIAPGSNKAILTLSNGKQIVLTGAPNGQVAMQGNTAVNKAANGELVYDMQEADIPAEPAFNTMTVPRGGQYHLKLSDGTDVWLNAASSIKYPAAFTGNDRTVEITGEAYFEVAHNKNKPFRVISKGQTVEVLGTHFNINAYNDEPGIKTTLLEGRVKIIKDQQSTVLKPRQQSTIADNGSAIVIKDNIDPEQVLAWKNGRFSFNETDVQTVMRQVGRWYDVDIKYSGKIPNDQLSGAFSRDINASKALKLLEFTGINFKIEGRTIIVN